MTGDKIIATAYPKGVFIEGIVDSSITPKPGTLMVRKGSTEMVNGKFTYTNVLDRLNEGDDGIRVTIAILIEDELQGKNYDDAYSGGETCFLYCPAPGEQFNMRVADVSGTGDDHAIGDLFISQTTTGKLIATTGSPEAEPFECLETSTNPTSEQLLLCEYTGY